ncbi:uncharacterized protein LOC113304762 [Papaver somniferum]|uniref:uncharacterized protein LOC113304762 n=1 Tax=Papaver somniferum TaxID=3469 RepID=UPI000E6F9DC0|nr:uncharacterized protein LOC113304762 [Papaver somniferum]
MLNSELQRLFSSCPLMETVIIQDWDIQRNENRKTNKRRNIIISSQCLQFFELIDRYHERLGSAVNCLNCSTKISAPYVKYFKCTGFLREDFSLENLSSLVSAHLEMRWRDKREADETAETYSDLLAEEKELFSKRMMRYLGAVHNVHHLTLLSGFLEVLLQAPGTSNRYSPQLCNLETLKLEMMFTRGSVRSIAYSLKISPIIRNLIFMSKESNLADVGDDWEAEYSSTGMFPHLKSVEIREVEGSDNELKFLIFLLKKSTVLEKVILFFRSTTASLDRGRQVRQFKRSVSELPTASSSIQMHFV